MLCTYIILGDWKVDFNDYSKRDSRDVMIKEAKWETQKRLQGGHQGVL